MNKIQTKGPRSRLFYAGIKALIQNDEGNILILEASLRDHSKGAQPYWDIPGGRIDEGEANGILNTLHREITEETGVTEVTDEVLYTAVVSHHEIPLDESKKAGLMLMIYTVKIPENSTITLSPEHLSYEWVTPCVAAERLSNKYPKEFTDKLADI